MKNFNYQNAVDLIKTGLQSESIKLLGNAGSMNDEATSASIAKIDAIYLKTLLNNLISSDQ